MKDQFFMLILYFYLNNITYNFALVSKPLKEMFINLWLSHILIKWFYNGNLEVSHLSVI